MQISDEKLQEQNFSNCMLYRIHFFRYFTHDPMNTKLGRDFLIYSFVNEFCVRAYLLSKILIANTFIRFFEKNKRDVGLLFLAQLHLSGNNFFH